MRQYLNVEVKLQGKKSMSAQFVVATSVDDAVAKMDETTICLFCDCMVGTDGARMLFANRNDAYPKLRYYSMIFNQLTISMYIVPYDQEYSLYGMCLLNDHTRVAYPKIDTDFMSFALSALECVDSLHEVLFFAVHFVMAKALFATDVMHNVFNQCVVQCIINASIQGNNKKRKKC